MSQRDRINQLKAQAQRLAGGQMKSSESDDLPPDVAEQFWRQVVEFETAPTTTNFQQLLDAGVALPNPDDLPDAEVSSTLWQVIHGLARLRVFLKWTDHLSDKELYSVLRRDVLQEEVRVLPADSQGADHVDLPGADPENRLYLKHYASDKERAWWLEDFPDDEMPAHEDPPFNRDCLLPRPHDEQGPEALQWLRANHNAYALATNRFANTGDALVFVERLYAAGARDVTIDNIMLLPSDQWAPYADTLIVTLPDDRACRRELFELIEHHGRPDEWDKSDEPLSDFGQNSIRLWWD